MANLYTIQDAEGRIIFAGDRRPSKTEEQSALALCARRAGVADQSLRLVRDRNVRDRNVRRFIIALRDTKKGWVGTYEIIKQKAA